MRTFLFRKLIRDKIPEQIQAQGGRVVSRQLSPENYLKELLNKLSEEAIELAKSKNQEIKEEFADLSEILMAIQRQLGISNPELVAMRERKNQKAGSFKNHTYIETIEVPDNYSWIEHYNKNAQRYPEVVKGKTIGGAKGGN